MTLGLEFISGEILAYKDLKDTISIESFGSVQVSIIPPHS